MDALATGHLNVPLELSWNWWPLTGVLLFLSLARIVIGLPLRAWLILPAVIAGEIFSIGIHSLGVLPTGAATVLLAAFGSLVVGRQRV